MKRTSVYSLLLLMFVLAGCPQLTKNSIDNGSYDVPSWLPGKWWATDNNGKKSDGYFLEKTAKKGNLNCYELDSLGKFNSADSKPVIMSSIGGKIFIGVYNRGDDMSDEGYYLFEFRKVSNTEFILAGIKEHTVDYDDAPDEIIKFLNKNKDNNDVYDPAETTRYKKQ